MTLSDLVTEFASTRAPGWLVITEPELLACGLEAARYYAAYGDIRSLSLATSLPGAPGAGGTITLPDPEPDIVESLPVKVIDLINEETELSVGEWAIIRPLFFLYVERENALRLEATRGMGLDVYGRNASEIASDIRVMEDETVPSKAFVCVGIEV